MLIAVFSTVHIQPGTRLLPRPTWPCTVPTSLPFPGLPRPRRLIRLHRPGSSGRLPIATWVNYLAEFLLLPKCRKRLVMHLKGTPGSKPNQYAIDEMLAIENDLPEATNAGGRLVKGAAQHNLAELYLALGTQLAADGKTAEAQAAFTKSVTYASKVIDGGTYALMKDRFGARRTEAQGNVYWDLFQENNVNYQDGNKECIWGIQIDYNAFKAEDSRSRLPYSRIYGPVFRNGAPAHLTGTLEDVGGRGISQVTPTMYTRDFIYGGKFAGDMRNSEIVFRRIFLGNVPTSPYYQKPVPWSVLYDNADDQSLDYPVSCKIATDKYTGIADGQDRSNLFRDDYFIRLPETILLRAEAKQRLGDKAGAANDVNLLRARAKCDYPVTAADMDDKFQHHSR